MRPLILGLISALLVMLTEGCLPVDSQCRARAVLDAEGYASQHIPEAQWQPKIEAEIRACIEEEDQSDVELQSGPGTRPGSRSVGAHADVLVSR